MAHASAPRKRSLGTPHLGDSVPLRLVQACGGSEVVPAETPKWRDSEVAYEGRVACQCEKGETSTVATAKTKCLWTCRPAVYRMHAPITRCRGEGGGGGRRACSANSGPCRVER